MSATSSGAQRDLRIDFFRGLALLFIFVDHVPDNVAAKFTLEELWLRRCRRGVRAAGRLLGRAGLRARVRGPGLQGRRQRASFERVRDIYLWHLALLVICGIGLTFAAATFGQPVYVNNIGVHVFAEDPGALDRAGRDAGQPAEHAQHPAALHRAADVLAAVRAVACCRAILGRRWCCRSACGRFQPAVGSTCRAMQHPHGWVFNPFAWQLLITIGALTAYTSRGRAPIPFSRPLMWLAIGLPRLCLPRTCAVDADPRPWRTARLFLHDMLGNVDKTYLSPWRLCHVVALGYLAMILLSPQSQWLSQAWATGIGRLWPALLGNLLPRNDIVVRWVGCFG